MGSRNPLYRVRVSSSGLIYAVIVGAWAAYLVPMWLRRQDELNEARPTERFSTAIRLLSGKAGMERRYAREAERRRVREGWAADDPYARRAGAEHEPGPSAAYGSDGDAYRSDPDAATEQAVDVRAFADPKTMVGAPGAEALTAVHAHRAESRHTGTVRPGSRSGRPGAAAAHGGHGGPEDTDGAAGPGTAPARAPGRPSEQPGEARYDQQGPDRSGPDRSRTNAAERAGTARPQTADSRTAQGAGRRAKQAKRAKLLARRRRTTMLLFLAFTVGTVVAAVRGLALLWVPAVPAVLLSVYIVHLRVQERRRFAFTMDRRRAEAAARSLRAQRPYEDAGPAERRRAEALHTDTEPGLPARTEGDGATGRQGRRHGEDQHPREERRSRVGGPPAAAPRRGAEHSGARPEAPAADRAGAPPEARARAEQQEAAERRALVEQTDHAEWVDQQRARDRDSSEGEGWDPVPVPLPTYVSAPVAPRATRGVDLEAPDAWSSARSSSVPAAGPHPAAEDETAADRDRTPLFDQYEGERRPRAANE